MRNLFRIFRNPVYCHALARRLQAMGVPYLPRLIDYFVRFFFACWLPHTVQIGRGFELGYGGLGCVFHSDTVIGDDVHVGTNVTVGGNAREPGAPRIGHGVYIGGGAQILGPITLGDGCLVGANAVVTRDVAPRTVLAGNPARVIREDVDLNEYLYHLREKGRQH
jgi:serine O-acetyltransferase